MENTEENLFSRAQKEYIAAAAEAAAENALRAAVPHAEFSRVPEEQYAADTADHLSAGEAEKLWNGIMLPVRATAGSAGYDFFSPESFVLHPGESLKVQTGIRCRISAPWCLAVFPRSGLGTKYGMRLANTAGIIDSDYYGADNYGHIALKIQNTGDRDICIPAGKAFCQGLFLYTGHTACDTAGAERKGGFGSSDGTV